MTDLPSRPDRGVGVALLDFLQARLLSIVALLVGAVVLVTYFVGVWTPPRFVWVVLATSIFGVGFGLLFGFASRSIVGSTDWYWLVDLDARKNDLAIYRMPQRHIADFDVLDGELNKPSPSIYVGRDVDLENRTVQGTWRGTFSDRELLASIQAVRECRGQLEDDARMGFALRNNLFSIVRSAVATNVETIVNAFESGTLPDKGDSIDSVVKETLGDFEADQESDSVVHDDDLDLDSLDLDDLKELQEFKMHADEHTDGETPSSDPLAPTVGGNDD